MRIIDEDRQGVRQVGQTRMTDKEDGKANRTRRTKHAKKGEQMRTDEEDN